MRSHWIKIGNIYLFSSDRGEHHGIMIWTLLYISWTRHQHPSFPPPLLICWPQNLRGERYMASEWVFAGSWRWIGRHLGDLGWHTGFGGWSLKAGILEGGSCFFPCLGLEWERLGGWVFWVDIPGGGSCFFPGLAWKGERGLAWKWERLGGGASCGTIMQPGCLACLPKIRFYY